MMKMYHTETKIKNRKVYKQKEYIRSQNKHV